MRPVITFCKEHTLDADKTKNQFIKTLFFHCTTFLYLTDAPEFKEENVREVLIPGGNVSFSCSAEGNPRPEIKWSYRPADNLKETTEGHQRIITVTGATSTNAGLYVCVATNKVGNVTRTVSLAERGTSMQNTLDGFTIHAAFYRKIYRKHQEV